MTAQFARAPHVIGRPAAPVQNAPHAALLIDFDNVTMGIRSDLTKELKSLLNSDIVKGKVAVQRAYADWRRYPQYIVPLAENSVDLIFAPAYGSSKKNATDIRLSIDALELVFTRPEIGTFILLSGDSDFSSLVLKLKEYGKYVIGIGIRESASDLLVQNCDEYYSYSALTGLTKAGDEETKQWDPWECVEIAVQRMADHNDVMRSDRLKQVILELDPNFDEKALGFTKFNRFIQEAANRGLIELNKLENGQFEVAPLGTTPGAVPGAGAAASEFADEADEESDQAAETTSEERPSRRGRRGGRGRGRDREREPREPREPLPTEPRAAEPAPVPENLAPAAERSATPPEKLASAPEAVSASPVRDLKKAYALLKTAVMDVSGGKSAARDSDVKRRILELNPEWSEPALGFSKFSRFLRQAHDAEVINLKKLENGNYEITLPGTPAGKVEEPAKPRGRGRGREGGRESSREGGRDRGRPEGEERSSSSRAPRGRSPHQLELASDEPAPRSTPEAAKPTPTTEASKPAAAEKPQAPTGRLYRAGSRGRSGIPAGPPPLLPGQTMAPKPAAVAQAEPPEAKPDASSALARLTAFKGVGQKTAEAAIQAFGPGVFDVLKNDPERVKETLGTRRAQPLLEGFAADQPKPNGGRRPARKGAAAAAKTTRRSPRGGRKPSGSRKS